jgi:hypothetical protein
MLASMLLSSRGHPRAVPDGQRTFRLIEGEPEPTSHGDDLYRQIFGVDDAA